MKSLAVFVVALCAVCLAKEAPPQPLEYSSEASVSPSSKTPGPTSSEAPGPTSNSEASVSSTAKSVPSSSKRPVPISKRLEQKFSEGRAPGRMEVSDAQLEIALKDKRYLQRQLKCTLGEAPCDPVGRRLRTLAPLVVRGSCPQCTSTEMRQIQKVLLHMQRNFPKEWARIVRTYQ